MDVQMIKLVSGEEIFGEVTSENTKAVTISNPIRIMYMPTEDGQGQMALMVEWLHSSRKEFVLRNELIMCRGPAVQEIINSYSQKYGSGLVVPNQGKELIV